MAGALSTHLKRAGYDLIDGPIRTHKPLQLWLKKNVSRAELYYDHVSHAFESNVVLTETVDNALNVTSARKNEYAFNIGLTVLEETLKALALGSFQLSSKLKSGKKVTISYDNSETRQYPVGKLQDYFTGADFAHPNPILLKQANLNNILVVSGAVFAKNLITEIETDFAIDADLVTSLNEIVDGKLEFSSNNQYNIKMTAEAATFFPVAVKANRLAFNRGVFKSLDLITDKREIF